MVKESSGTTTAGSRKRTETLQQLIHKQSGLWCTQARKQLLQIYHQNCDLEHTKIQGFAIF
ncbi:hypothetical protein A3843_02325 [Pseudovibrio exalbescens]|uniref:Uncharacterized protein n=1 Tax=Pseudovibrio exalbescens TaxID=197461 RepID=A0A1U7JKD5_9HYPH|nr:hypothetical protein A3843_02325 [Pseudovibrio exalbescens]